MPAATMAYVRDRSWDREDPVSGEVLDESELPRPPSQLRLPLTRRVL